MMGSKPARTGTPRGPWLLCGRPWRLAGQTQEAARRGASPFRASARCAATLGAMAVGASLTVTAAATTVERIVAIVSDRPILLSDLRARALPMLLRIHSELPPGAQRAAAVSQVYKQMLDKMVDEELERLAATRAEVAVSAKEVEDALLRVARGNQISVERLMEEAAKMGLSPEQYRAEIRRQLLEAKLLNVRLQGRIRISEEEVRSSYRVLQVEERTSQPCTTAWIVLRGSRTQPSTSQPSTSQPSTSQPSTIGLPSTGLPKTGPQRASGVAGIPGAPAGARSAEELRALADQVAARARQGENFAELAALFSEDADTRDRGGLMGEVRPEQLPAELKAALVELEVGEVSAPLRVRGDLVIVELVARPESALPTLEESREELANRIYMDKMARARRHWLDSLRKREHIDVRL